MTLSERLDRLELICRLIWALYATQTGEQYEAAMERLREAMKETQEDLTAQVKT